MSMPNSEYWKQRFTQLEEARNKQANETFADIAVAYRKAEKQLEAEVDRWYRRFADNNSITLPEARKLLTKGELREFKWDVREYMKYAEENMITGQWEKELENASARFHISRLEALKINTAAAIEELYNKEEQKLNFHLSEEYQTDYYRTIYEIQKGYNTYFDVAKLDLNRIDKLLKKPWAPDGYNFSERIWNDKNKLINNVHRDLMQCIKTGEPLNKAIDRLTKRMNTARCNAERLIRTENAWSASLATEDGFKELDVEKYEIIAALDDRTCAGECQGLDGQVYEMKDYQAGLTAPPFHPNCRCSTAPHFDKWYGLKRQRAARDENGKNYTVDADMKYPEWKKVFVDKEMSYKDWQAKSAPKASTPALKTESKAKTEPKIKKANSIEEAEKFALSNGVRHVDYSDLPLETANLLNVAAMTLPEDIRPAYIASSKNIEKAIGRKLSRSAKDFYGVHLDVMDLRFGEYPNIEYDFEGGQVVGISSSFKKLEKIKDAKLKVDKIYSEKHDGHTWFFNVDGTSTPFHEMGHVYADKKGIPKGFAEDAEKWFKKAQCDMLKDIDEAWAEAWGGYHTQNPDLPDYIAKYIHNATNMPIDKSVEKLI